MRNRWGILAILFVVRLTIAFQFQSVAAVAPLLQQTFGVGLADIGILIGPGLRVWAASRDWERQARGNYVPPVSSPAEAAQSESR